LYFLALSFNFLTSLEPDMLNKPTSVDSVSNTEETSLNLDRRSFMHTAALTTGASMMSLAMGGVWAAGSDKPEKEEVKVGFIPLTDCASVVMAAVLGFDKKYGIKIILHGLVYATNSSMANSTQRTCCTA
jgi:hypothetical protein